MQRSRTPPPAQEDKEAMSWRVLTMAWMVLLLWLLTYDPGQGLGLCILWGISKQSLRVLVSITIPVCLLLLLVVDA